MLNLHFKPLTLVFAVTLGTATGWASVGGSISGIVQDASGAVVPNAQVTITNVSTGVSQVVTSSDVGVYAFLELPVGAYQLKVTKQGFETYESSGITVNTNDQLRHDVTLHVGQVTQEVKVTANTSHVETENTQLGDVIESQAISALPLNGRQFTDLLGLQPGVVPSLPASSLPTYYYFASTELGNISISGQRETANGFLINGSNVNNPANNGTTVIPNLDSIDEFRVLTDNFNAEYGNYMGGLISVVTKSGTNKVHGDAFDFLRNTDLDARNFFDINRGTFQQNQFGGTLGGPIKHEKVFFFLDYQGTRTNQGQSSGVIPVPSAAERSGNFSAVAESLTGTVDSPFFASVLSKQLGYPVSAGEPYFVPTNSTQACTLVSQCVFPNGIVPQSAFSGPANALMKYIPLPNEGQSSFVSTANATHTRDDLGSLRIDGNSRRWGMLSAYYFIDNNFELVPFGTNNVPGFPTSNNGRSQLIALSDAKSFGATALNDLHLSFNRSVFLNSGPVGSSIPPTQLGFEEGVPGGLVPTTSPKYYGAPQMFFNNFSIGSTAANFDRISNIPMVLDNFSKVIGTHTLKFGGEYVFNDFTQGTFDPGNGFFGFTGNETGSDFADFLIGAPNNFGQSSFYGLDSRRNYAGIFGQDSWRAKHDLMLNYGSRWDFFQPWYEKYNQLDTLVQGVQSTIFPGAPTGLVFPGDTVPGFGKIPRTISRMPLDNFGARLGLAYSPSLSTGWLSKLAGGPGKFSIRMGFGMFYTNVDGFQQIFQTGLAPFAEAYFSPEPPLFATPYIGRLDGSIHPSPFPFIPSPSYDFGPDLPLSGYPVAALDDTTPRSQNYNFTLERQFGNNTIATLGYVGSQGHHLLSTLPNNPGNPQLCLSLSQLNDVAPGTGTCGPFAENGVFERPDGTIVNSTRGPFGPDFGSNVWTNNIGNSNYNALQASLRYTSHRLTFFASYTYGKSIDNESSVTGTINPINEKLDKALSTFDLTHNFVISYNYELPFDYFAHNRWSRLTSGWHLVGITRFTTGFPVIMTTLDDLSLLGQSSGNGGVGVDTPDFLGGNLDFTNPRTGMPYFNVSLFTPEQLGHIGTSNRAFFHGPGTNNFDMSLQKDVRLRETKALEFRAEFFNIFNHAQFLDPSGNIDANFGVVTQAAAPRIAQLALKLLF
jgi:hypothetical protein